MTRRFIKPSLTIPQQIAHLESVGMTVADQARAEHWLRHVSYYRLSGYWHIWKDGTPGATGFVAGTDFDRTCALYGFDRNLRSYGYSFSSVIIVIDPVKPSCRSMIAHCAPACPAPTISTF